MGCNNILLLYGIMVNRTGIGVSHTRVGIASSFGILRLSSPISCDRPPCFRRPLQNSWEAIFSVALPRTPGSPGRGYLLRHSREACPVLRYGDGNLKPFFQGIAALQPAFLDSCFRRALNNLASARPPPSSLPCRRESTPHPAWIPGARTPRGGNDGGRGFVIGYARGSFRRNGLALGWCSFQLPTHSGNINTGEGLSPISCAGTVPA